MEQKRILWILLASGFFLLVVIGAAALFFHSSGTGMSIQDATVWTAPPAIQGTGTATPEPYAQGIASAVTDEVSPAPAATQEGGITQTDSLTVIANGTTNIYGVAGESQGGTTTIDLNMLKNADSGTRPSETVAAQNQAAQQAMQVAASGTANTTGTANATGSTGSAASTGTASASGTATAASASSATTSSTTATSSAGTKSTSTTTTTTTKTTTTTAASTTKTQAVADRFWVQAASYSSKKNADEARSVLDQNGIQCEVFTYTDAKGTLFYRVRVGPYTTKSEAEYWKKRIDAIELFAGNATYITNSSAPAAK